MCSPALLPDAAPDSKGLSSSKPKVSPGLRVSLQGALKLIAMLAATVRAGALPLPDHPAPLAPLSLVDVTGLACAAGACSTLVGVTVGDYLYPAECPIIANTLQGMGTRDDKVGSRKVVFFQWDDIEATFDPAAGLLGVQPWSGLCKPSTSGRFMDQVLSTQHNLTARFANLRNRTHPGLPLQPGEPGSAVVGLANGMLALGRQNSRWTIQSPWKPHTTLKIDDTPMDQMADDLLHRMQSLSPTVFVADEKLFVPKRMGRPINSDVVQRHFLAKGYFIVHAGTTAKPDRWRAVLLMPPTPGIIDTFGSYAEHPVDGLRVQRPTREAIREFNKMYPRSEPQTDDGSPEIGAVVLGIALATGTALVLSAINRRAPAQDAREPEAASTAPQQPELPGPVRRARGQGLHPQHTMAPPIESKSPLPSIIHTPHSVGEVFNETVRELETMSHRKRCNMAGALGRDAEAALDAGNPVKASIMIRALSAVEKDPTSLGRALMHFGVSLPEITGALLQEVHGGPDSKACLEELTRLEKCQTYISLAMPSAADYQGDEKGRVGPAQRLARPPAKPGASRSQDTDTKAPPADYRGMAGVRDLAARLVRQGRGEVVDGQTYICGRPQATPHLHVGRDFLSLKMGNHSHLRIFTNGGTLRPQILERAIEYARTQPGVSADLLDVLLFIKNQGPYAGSRSSQHSS
jgi:hypothetical protein